jgi:3-hydroxybutyryl-CoA dehydrogenase/5-formyl-3-hydroxy-2-methylpyridine 4-carboxylate dehydrogenase
MSGPAVKTVAVVGAGTMGPGMAAMFASHGFDVRLTDVKLEILERARGGVESVLKTLVDGGLLGQADAEAAVARLTITLDLQAAVAGAELVVEAIPERLDVKQRFFAEIEPRVGESTILASNTSGLPITKLGDSVRRPERVVGMHWSNPPHLIPVIEIIRGERTGDGVVAATREVVERLGMLPVVVQRDVPGFVENRILYAIMREALHLLEEGIATPEDIDTITRWGIGYKLAVIGPLELLDVAGLDIYHSVASYLNADLSSRTDVSPLVRQKVAAGELGIKTGKGLFAYTAESIPPLMQRRMRLLLASRKTLSQA